MQSLSNNTNNAQYVVSLLHGIALIVLYVQQKHSRSLFYCYKKVILVSS